MRQLAGLVMCLDFRVGIGAFSICHFRFEIGRCPQHWDIYTVLRA